MTTHKKTGEEGYLLLGVIFLLALLVLSLSVAIPRIRADIQRDRDLETMHRGKQYIRAIKLYYRKFGAYPPNIDALVNTNDIRFLRKRYIDPTTGQDDWKPVLFGQNKTPTAMGFFGQPLATGSSLAGIGPNGGGTGLTPGGGINGSNPVSGLGSTNSTATPPASGPTTPPGTSTSAFGSTDSSSSSGLGPSTGQSFGGAGIIGFSPASPKESILVYKKKNHYNEWEFTYDPAQDQQTITSTSNGALGTPGTGTTTPVGGPGFGNPSAPPPQTPQQPQPQQ